MSESTANTRTSTALLAGLQHGESDVWCEFDARYRPIVVGFARRLGLQLEDAADVAQDALAKFAQDYREGKYQRERGRLRTWLMTIVRYRALDARRALAARREQPAGSKMIELEDEQRCLEHWELERKTGLLRQALAELRKNSRIGEKTLAAFEQYVLKQRKPEDVAAELGLTPHDVYMAKNRVAERLREILVRLEQLFDDG